MALPVCGKQETYKFASLKKQKNDSNDLFFLLYQFVDLSTRLNFSLTNCTDKWNIEHQDDGFGRDFHNSLSKWDRFSNWTCFGVSSWADIDTIQFINVYNRLWLSRYTKNIIFSDIEWHPIEQISECPNAKAVLIVCCRHISFSADVVQCSFFLRCAKNHLVGTPGTHKISGLIIIFLIAKWCQIHLCGNRELAEFSLSPLRRSGRLPAGSSAASLRGKGQIWNMGPMGRGIWICEFRSAIWSSLRKLEDFQIYLHAEIDVSIFLHFSVSIYFLFARRSQPCGRICQTLEEESVGYGH